MQYMLFRRKIGFIIIFFIISSILTPVIFGENSISNSNNNYDLPDYFSWKDYKGYDWTTTAKDQAYPKYCGSCWVFAALGALESCIKISRDNPNLDIDLSEQYVLSCLSAAGSCRGGYPGEVFRCIQSDSSEGNFCNGIIPEACMPYQADDDVPCEEKCDDWEEHLIPIYDYGGFGGGIAISSNVKSKILEFGPITGTMLVTEDFNNWLDNNHDSNQYYPYKYPVSGTNHAVVVLGWKDDLSVDKGGYWICKNSHGTAQGYDGFFNIEYGALNICSNNNWVSAGISDLYSYGELSWTDIKPGDQLYGNFTIENIGEYGSTLHWNILEFPYWGEWSIISPKIGSYITPYDGLITVEVSLKAPENEGRNFNGRIKIVNINNEDDYEIIEVSLSTMKDKENDFSLGNLLFERFPFLQSYLSNFIK